MKVTDGRRLAACLALGLALTAGAGPGETLTRYEFDETHMGSQFHLVLYSPDASTARRASRAAYDRIAALDAALSDYNPDSELMRLCDRAGGPPVKVSDDLFDVLQRAIEMHKRSDGAFDVTVGPVVRLWRRAFRDRQMPAADRLAEARALVGSDKIKLDPQARTIQLLKRGMKLDLGGIAKGYASQAAVDVLKREGIDRALCAGAGDIVVSRPPPGKNGWVIGIAPLEAFGVKSARRLLLANRAVSTAGDTERFVEIDGKRYSHIVDPRTGLGIVDRASVTVVADDGATADALDTAVYGLGPERGLPLVEATDHAAAFIMRQTPDGLKTYESARFRTLPTAGE
ncbi:MAG: FAD:protein FMN transferase [Isosphaeraceae bacterium]|nr:FAD:protein FMN transferase [Isosphaeraceae bacterium]